MNQKLDELYRSEVNSMRKIKSSNVIKLYAEYENNYYVYVVMEYCDSGDLEQFLRTMPKKRFSEQ
jgi:polo-like kinase 4